LEKLLFFSTGSIRVPAGGFANLRDDFGFAKLFGILRNNKKEAKANVLAHTCSFTIEIPEYSSYKVLARQVELAFEYEGRFEIV
jgi:hypothetical protein